MKKLLRFLLVVLLLFSIKSSALAISDTVAVLVDSLVFSEIEDEVNEYVQSVEAEFPVKVLVFHNHDWKNKSFYETRKFIKNKWEEHHIKGVVLIGYFPLMLYQVKGQGSFPMVQALGYEDIDGEFTNEGTFDGSNFISGKADPTWLKDAHGRNRTFKDTIYDHHYWADNVNFSNAEEVREKVKLELWCALIRPYQESYSAEEYTPKAVDQLKTYLKRCARYCRKELPYKRRGFVQAAKDWSSSVGHLAGKMKPIYGENNVASCPSSSSGYTYMRERATGMELACYYAHSSSWFHQNDRPPFQTIQTVDLVKRKGPGAILTLGFNCHGADYFETPTGCLGQHYMFEGMGLAFVGNTISTGNNQSEMVTNLASGDYLGNAFLKTLNKDYQDAVLRGSTAQTQQMWGNIILGNPFIWANADKDMSHPGARVTGSVSNGEDLILKLKRDNNIYTICKTNNGEIDFAKIDTGKYEVVIETLNGALLPSQELDISEVGQQISNWNIEVPYFNQNIESYYVKTGAGKSCPADWNLDGANLGLWNRTTADAIGKYARDYNFYDYLSEDNAEGKVYLRKHFSVNKLKPGSRVFVYSANTSLLLYVNGKNVSPVTYFPSRWFPGVIRTCFDITDELVDGNNFMNAVADDFVHISNPVYEMESEPVVPVPDKPSEFFAQLLSNGGLKFSWTDNSDNEDGFLLEQKMQDGTYEIVSYIAKNKTELVYSKLDNNLGLSFRICAFNFAGISLYDTALKTETLALAGHSELKLYPNPFNDKIVVRNIQPNSVVLIRNLSGQQVYNSFSNNTDLEINLGMLPDGIYLVSLIGSNGESTVKKLVKN